MMSTLTWYTVRKYYFNDVLYFRVHLFNASLRRLLTQCATVSPSIRFTLVLGRVLADTAGVQSAGRK